MLLLQQPKKEKWSVFIEVTVLLCAIMSPLLMHHYQVTLKKNLHEEMSVMNLTNSRLPNHHPHLLVFARVPKTASQTVNVLLTHLNDTNQFKLFDSLDGMFDAGQDSEYAYETDVHQRQRNIMAFIQQGGQGTGAIYSRHQNFWDFSEFHQEKHQPLYFSFVRHPIERAISWYYYIRSPAYQMTPDGQNIDTTLSVRALKESFEDCVLNGRPECQFNPGMSIHRAGNSHSSQLAFFCGHASFCDQFESDELYKQAIENFNRHFPVVGVTELFNQSVRVLEAFLPRYFEGASRVVQNDAISTNRNAYKPPVSAYIRSLLERNMSKEIDFYHLARQRLVKQYKSLQLP